MNRALIYLGLASSLVGCSHTVPAASTPSETTATPASKPSETIATATARFVPVSGNNPYIMFDEQTAQACWSGPVARAVNADARYPAWFHPDNANNSSAGAQDGQPYGKFAEDAKGIPNCRQLVAPNRANLGPPPKTAEEFLKKYSKP